MHYLYEQDTSGPLPRSTDDEIYEDGFDLRPISPTIPPRVSSTVNPFRVGSGALVPPPLIPPPMLRGNQKSEMPNMLSRQKFMSAVDLKVLSLSEPLLGLSLIHI